MVVAKTNGRPRGATEEQVRAALDEIALGTPPKSCALMIGISVRTLYRWAEDLGFQVVRRNQRWAVIQKPSSSV